MEFFDDVPLCFFLDVPPVDCCEWTPLAVCMAEEDVFLDFLSDDALVECSVEDWLPTFVTEWLVTD